MDQLRFNSGNSGILESTQEYSGITWGSYGNDSGMTQEYLRNSGRVQDMTGLLDVDESSSCPLPLLMSLLFLTVPKSQMTNCHIPNFHLRIPSSTERDRAIPRITASPKYSDSD